MDHLKATPSLGRLVLVATLACGLVPVESANACLRVCNLPKEGNVRGKAIDGLECQIDWLDKNKDWGYTNIGQICNGGYEEILVHCPLMRTEMPSTKGLTCASATLVVQQGKFRACGPLNPEQWDCVLRSQDDTGWYGWYIGSGPWSLTNDTGTYNFSPGFPGANVWSAEWQAAINDSYEITPERGASYMMSCFLPPPGSCGGETCLSSLKWWER